LKTKRGGKGTQTAGKGSKGKSQRIGEGIKEEKEHFALCNKIKQEEKSRLKTNLTIVCKPHGCIILVSSHYSYLRNPLLGSVCGAECF